MDKRIIFTIILVVYIGFMVFGAVIPNPNDIPGFGGNTKIFHVLGFIVLTILTLKTFEFYRFKQYYLLSIMFVAFFIYLTEFLQLFVPSRHFLYTDMLIDAASMIIGVGCYKWIFSKVLS